MTSCFNFACGFSSYPQGVVFMCRVKPGIMLGFNEYVPGYVKEDQDSNVNFITNEYVIYDKNRVLPIAMIENTMQRDTLLSTLPTELSMLISAANKSLDETLLTKPTDEEVDWLCEQERGLTGINIVPTWRSFGGCVARQRKGNGLVYYRIIDKDGKYVYTQEGEGVRINMGLRLAVGRITGFGDGVSGTPTILDVSSTFTLMKKRAESLRISIDAIRNRTNKFLRDTLTDLATGPGYQELYLKSCCRHLSIAATRKEEMIAALEKHISQMN